MPSERIQRRIQGLLDEADQALRRNDWQAVVECAAAVLALDPSDEDAKHYRDAAERGLVTAAPKSAPKAPSGPVAEAAGQPSAFASGRYVVRKFLGEGGKKKVYLAHDTVLDRDVAFALIKTEGLDETSRQRITREAQAMGRLGDHANIMPIFDLGQERDPATGIQQPFMVLPQMTGGDVEGVIQEAPDHRMPLERTLQIAKDTCEGLVFAHSKGIVHRDLKPGNVWLTQEGRARIGDFGLAVATDRSRLTREAMMVGTVAYMPPEQAMGGEITPRADLYSLGAMLYEMVTGRPPFLGDDDIAIIGQHINTPPVAPSWHNPQCPKPLEALIMRLLAKDPAQRPESAKDVLSALSAIDLHPQSSPIARTQEKGNGERSRSLDSMSSGVFVGRHKEMDQLRAALEEALSGHGRMVTLVGEPGIGKTRTSFELATYAGLRNCQILWGRCYEGTGAPPYWPWVQAIRSYVHEKDPAELRRELGSAASVIAEVVTDIRERLPDLQPAPRVDDAESARFRLFDSIATFLRNASRNKPILLILDDLHWSDKPSLLFLEFLAREIGNSRILLLGTYRDVDLNRRHPLAVTLGDLTKDRLFERVLLRGLHKEDVGRFVELAAGVNPPPALVETVFRHTEGNPLFVTETVRLLIQEGELHRASGQGDGIGRRTTSWEIRIPEGVREVIGRRLDRLSERCNDVLTSAAVIGRQFRFEVLKKLIDDLTEDRLLDVLDETLAARIIEELPSEIGLYQFTHALLQETLTSELSLTRRVRLHARIAEALEAVHGVEAERHAAELAHHFEEAQTLLGSDKLIRYSLLAGQQALAAYGFEEAERHFQRGLQAKQDKPDDLEKAEFLYGLGQALVQTLGRTEMQRALDSLAEAFDLFVKFDRPAKAVAAAATSFPNIQGVTGRARLIERALELVGPESRDRALLLAGLAMAGRYELYDDDLADRSAAESATIAQSLSESAIELKARLVQIAVRPGEVDVGVNPAAERRAGELLSLVKDPSAEANYHEMVANGHSRRGNLAAAERSYETALAAAERAGNRWHIAAQLSNLGLTAISSGDWNQARQLLERGLTHSPGEWRLRWPMFRIAFELGQLDTGKQILESILSEAAFFSGLGRRGVTPVVFNASIASTITGLDLCPSAVFDSAWKFFFSDERPVGFRRITGSALARVLLVRGDAEGLSRVVPRLMQIWNVRAYWSFTVGLSSDARAAATVGDYQSAEKMFTAIEQKPSLGVPDRAWLYYDWGEALIGRNQAGDRQRAIKYHDEALKIAQRLGMKPLIERVIARKKILTA